VFLADKKSPFDRREIGYHLFEVDRSRSRFNVELEDSLFVVDFPPGTEVIDEIRNTVYRVGSETQQSYLDLLALQGRLSVESLQKVQPRFRKNTIVAVTARQQTLLWVNVSVLLAVALLLVYRWRSHLVRRSERKA
jgi:hypothetical protein